MKKRVLIVDDDKKFRRLVRKRLEKEGVEVSEAFNPKDALTKCQSQQPDLIVLDLFLPDEAGFEIQAKIAKGEAMYGQPKIIAVSGFLVGFAEHDPETKVAYQVDHFMSKPLNLDELIWFVRGMSN